MDTDVLTALGGFTNIVTTRNTANGVGAPATGMDAPTVLIGCTGTARAATSASGAVRPPMALVVRTPQPAATRSNPVEDGVLYGAFKAGSTLLIFR